MALTTGNRFLDALGGTRWADPWVNITFNDSGQGGAWTGGEIGAFTAAFQTWANVAAVNWGFGSVPGGSNIVEYKRTSVQMGATTLGAHNTPGQSVHDGEYNINLWWTPEAMRPGGYTFATLIHEIGHAIGLAHPHDKDDGTGLFPGVLEGQDKNTGSNGLNHNYYTIMSYNRPPQPPVHSVPPPPAPPPPQLRDYGYMATPMAFDIAAIQQLYGANTTHNDGHNTYFLRDSNTPGTKWMCIWDVGGFDTIAYDGLFRVTIDLRPATLLDAPGGGGFKSEVQGFFGGFLIAADFTNAAFDSGAETGVVIEAARGGAHHDTLMGNRADNILHGQGGADSMNGGDGDDMASYFFASASVIADLLFPDGNRRDAFGDSYISIERLEGSSFDDHLGGNHASNTIYGGDGADLIAGRGGNDALYGDLWNDTLAGDGGADTLYGGSGDDLATYQDSPASIVVDLLFPGLNTWEAFGDAYDSIENLLGSIFVDRLGGDHGANTIYGWAGDDFIAGRNGDDMLWGQENNDSLLGEVGFDTLYGGDGNDTLDGGAQFDHLDGGFGDDWFFVNSNADRVREAAGAGYDRVFTSATFSLHLTLAEVEELRTTNEAATTRINLTGSATPNLIVGNAGANRIDGRDGADTMWGLGGADTFTVDNSADVVIEADVPGDDMVFSSAPSFSLAGSFAERLTLLGTADIHGAGNGLDNDIIGNTGANSLAGEGGADWFRGQDGNDTISGGEGNDIAWGVGGDDLLFGDGAEDRLYGGIGNDTLSGGAGNDYLRGDTGADSLVGGSDFDTADYISGFGPVWLSLATGGTLGDAAGDHYESIEAVTGTRYADSIVGDGGDNLINGGSGNDSLDGRAGRDTLQGGAGNDFLYVDTGDRVLAGTGYDYVNALETTAATGFVFVATDVMEIEAIQGHDGNDRINAAAMTTAITIVAHAGNDTVLCGSGDDGVFGFDGHDSIHGGAGFDQMNGGNGNDTIVGGGGPVNPPWGDWLFGGAGNDLLTGSNHGVVTGDDGDDTLTGGAGDLLKGGSGADLITGSAGLQQIIGEAGADTMSGGADYDRFDFDDGWGDDLITDFEVGVDKIALFDVAGLDLFSQLVLTDEAGGVRIAFGADRMLLANWTAAQLLPEDFLL